MYYAEQWIDGKLYWRSTPDGEWIEADAVKLNKRLIEAQQQLREARKEARELALDAVAEARWQERQGADYGSY